MGWGPGDQEVVATAKVATSRSRVEVYKLMKILETVKHDEKRTVLVKLGAELYDKLNEIDSQLSR